MLSGGFSQFDSLLGDITSTELRIGTTLSIFLIAVVLGQLLVPRVADRVRATIRVGSDRLAGDRLETSREAFIEAVPIGGLISLFVGAVQLALFISAAAAILIVWGQLDLVVALVPFARNAVAIGWRLVISAVLLFGAYVGSRVLEDVIAEFSADSDRVTAHHQQLLTRIAQVSLLVLAGITVLGVWGVNLSGLLVGAGFLGIVVGMAARQTLGSLIAGFVLMFSRPFEIGDWVEIGDEEGFITDITIMNTHIRNFDGEFVVIPNDHVGNVAITNRSREGRLRINMQVGIDYEDDPAEASDIARTVLEGVDVIENQPQPIVIPSSFGDSAVLLDIRFWIEPPTPQLRWRSKSAAVTGIRERFAEEGISIPFPQRVLTERPPVDAASDKSVPNTVTTEGPQSSD